MATDAFAAALGTIEKKIGKAIKPVNQNLLCKKLITDSPRLNYEYGGGIKIGCFHRYMGPESGGKSTICTYIAGQFQKHLAEQHPDLADHKKVVYLDFERSFDPDHASENGLNTRSVIDDNGKYDPEGVFVLLQPDNLEDGAIALEEMIKTNTVAVVIFDSESMAPTRTVMQDEFNKANFGSGAKALKEFCNRFNILCANYNTTMFVISQERAQMQAMSHAIATTGGYALKYVASTLNRVRKIENLTEGSKIVGIHMQVRNYKNKTGIPFRECEMDLYYKGGFDSTGEFVDFLFEFADDPRLLKHVDCRSRGYYNSKTVYGWNYHGKDSFVEAINNGDVPAVQWDAIKNAIQDIISHEIEGQEFTGDEDQLAEQELTKEKAEELSNAEIEKEEEELKKKTKMKKVDTEEVAQLAAEAAAEA